jgi:outer membrane murein-binding lipoprotein Lpp
MADQLEERVAALERAVTDGEGDCTALADGAAKAERIDELESTVEELQASVADLEAATQALRGYVGNVRSVNEEVEQRADLALSRVEELAAEQSDGDDGATHTERRCEECGRPHDPGDGGGGTGAEQQRHRDPGRDLGPGVGTDGPRSGDRAAGAGRTGWDGGESFETGSASATDRGLSGGATEFGEAADGEDGTGAVERLRRLL